MADTQNTGNGNNWRAGTSEKIGALTAEVADHVAFVVSLNIKRRNLDEGQRGIVAARAANLTVGRPSDNSANLPNKDAAQMLNVSERTVRSARKVLDKGTPGLVHAAEQGQIAVSLAAKLADAEPEFQTAVINRMREEKVKPVEAARREKAARISGISYGSRVTRSPRRGKPRRIALPMRQTGSGARRKQIFRKLTRNVSPQVVGARPPRPRPRPARPIAAPSNAWTSWRKSAPKPGAFSCPPHDAVRCSTCAGPTAFPDSCMTAPAQARLRRTAAPAQRRCAGCLRQSPRPRLRSPPPLTAPKRRPGTPEPETEA